MELVVVEVIKTAEVWPVFGRKVFVRNQFIAGFNQRVTMKKTGAGIQPVLVLVAKSFPIAERKRMILAFADRSGVRPSVAIESISQRASARSPFVARSECYRIVMHRGDLVGRETVGPGRD